MLRELTEHGDFMTEWHALDRRTLREQGEVEPMEEQFRRGERTAGHQGPAAICRDSA